MFSNDKSNSKFIKWCNDELNGMQCSYDYFTTIASLCFDSAVQIWSPNLKKVLEHAVSIDVVANFTLIESCTILITQLIATVLQPKHLCA